jgi:hypothetical protein
VWQKNWEQRPTTKRIYVLADDSLVWRFEFCVALIRSTLRSSNILDLNWTSWWEHCLGLDEVIVRRKEFNIRPRDTNGEQENEDVEAARESWESKATEHY